MLCLLVILSFSVNTAKRIEWNLVTLRHNAASTHSGIVTVAHLTCGLAVARFHATSIFRPKLTSGMS